MQREEGEELATFLFRVKEHFGIPALAVAHFGGGGLDEAVGVGSSCVGRGNDVDADSRFHVGSLAKSMTGTVAASLVEEGRLSWTATMAAAFPDPGLSINPVYLEVTLQDLLRHRAGFAPWWSDADEFDVYNIVPDLSGTRFSQRRRFSAWILEREADVSPGQIQYSNAGYVVAAANLEGVTGSSWEDLVEERLFHPLGLTSAGFGWPAGEDSSEPCGHLEDSQGALYVAPLDYHRLPVVFAPSGDVHMSIRDLAKYGVMHLRGLGGHDGLLTAETVRFLHSPVGDYAIGWGIGTGPTGGTVSDHEGGAGTFYASIVLIHDTNRGCAVLANTGAATARMAAANVCVELLLEEADR